MCASITALSLKTAQRQFIGGGICLDGRASSIKQRGFSSQREFVFGRNGSLFPSLQCSPKLKPLAKPLPRLMLDAVSDRRKSQLLNCRACSIWLPAVLMLVFAATRWPGLMPANFSAAYALTFCAGVYFGKRTAWFLPLITLLLTDIALNIYYNVPFHWYQLFNYAGYTVLISLGRCLSTGASFLKLLGGSLLGAIFFYLATNTAAWFFNPFKHPEYTRDFAGWAIALIQGDANWPETWVFFRNTLASSALFTALFVGAMKLAECPQTEESRNRSKVPSRSLPG